MLVLDISTFFGRLHPMVVHLPIGFLLLAAFFDVLSYKERYNHLQGAINVTLGLGFISAVVACILGYMLSFTGDYDRTILNNHKISGIALALLSGLLYIAGVINFTHVFPLSRKLFSSLFIIVIVVMVYAGHQGSSLTHGDDYLNLNTLVNKKREKPKSVEEALIFEDVVQPMIQNKCASCHREGKLKGKLSVETLGDLLKGGKTGPAIIPGNPNDSELIKRISLEVSDEKFMPKEGKTPLTKDETAIIRWWIEKAKATGGKRLIEIESNDDVKGRIASYLNIGQPLLTKNDTTVIEQVINPDLPMQAVDMLYIESLREKDWVIRIMLNKPVMLDVSLPAHTKKESKEIEKDLAPIVKSITWLNLSSNDFTEADLSFVSQCTNVEKLRLEKNPISDGIVDHLINLKHLEALNLNETKITKSCIDKLKQIATLKRIYTWKSGAEK